MVPQCAPIGDIRIPRCKERWEASCRLLFWLLGSGRLLLGDQIMTKLCLDLVIEQCLCMRARFLSGSLGAGHHVIDHETSRGDSVIFAE